MTKEIATYSCSIQAPFTNEINNYMLSVLYRYSRSLPIFFVKCSNTAVNLPIISLCGLVGVYAVLSTVREFFFREVRYIISGIFSEHQLKGTLNISSLCTKC